MPPVKRAGLGKTTRKQLPPQGKTILSYIGKIISSSSDDELREFIVNFCPEDSTFAVLEKKVPNSGFPGGRFIGTTKVVHPETGRPYKPDDVTVGHDVVVNGWRFHLIEASEGTLKIMEQRPEMFNQSDSCKILARVKREIGKRMSSFESTLRESDPQNHEKVPKAVLLQTLSQFGVALSEQEVITIFRRYRFALSDLTRYGDLLTDLK